MSDVLTRPVRLAERQTVLGFDENGLTLEERITARVQALIDGLPQPAAQPTLRSQLSDLNAPEVAKLQQHLYDAGRADLTEGIIRENRAAVDMIIRPAPKMTVPEFIERHRFMAPEQGSTPGPFKIANQQIAEGPMLCAHEPGVRTITFCCSPQMCKTLIIECLFAYFAVVDPTTQLIVEPTDPAVKALSFGKIGKMIENMPILKARMQKNGMYLKTWPGGFGILTNSGSDTNLGMNTIRIVYCDETDKFGMTKSGPALELAEERASTWGELALMIRTCTPTFEQGTIWKLWLAGDMRRYFITCPGCQHEQVPEWTVMRRNPEGFEEEVNLVRWRNDGTGKPVPGTAFYHCSSCDRPFSEPERKRALRRGVWRQTKPFRCCDEMQDPMVTRAWNHDHWKGVGYAMCSVRGPKCDSYAVPDLPGSAVSNQDASFHAWRAHSQRHGMDEVAKKFSTQTKQAFDNNMLALPYRQGTVTEIDGDGLLRRREAYTTILNDRGILLTAGVDVQQQYLAIQIILWGRNKESWVVHYEEIPGDTMLDSVWMRLDSLLRRIWETKGGRKLFVEAACVDTGGGHGRTDRAAHWCHQRIGRMILPINGARGEDGINYKPLFPRKASLGKAIYAVGTLAGKDETLRCLSVSKPGPGFCHFPATVDKAYFEQLTAEKKCYKENGAVFWEKIRKRNEAFDTRVYALAALESLTVLREGFDLHKLADHLGIPREIPEAEKNALSEEAMAATRAAMSEMVDERPRTVVKTAHRRAFRGLRILNAPGYQRKPHL